VNTGWTTHDLSASGGATSLALTIPGVGAYLSGTATVAHTWCPSGTSSNYASLQFYPQGDYVPTQTDALAATTDGQHILGAAVVGGRVQLSDIRVSIPFVASTGTATGGSVAPVNLPLPCPESGTNLQPLELTHTLSQLSVSGVNVDPANPDLKMVASPSTDLTFLTYNSSTPGAKLPYYMPGSNGTAGTVNYVTLSGGNAVTAPIAGAFSLDNQYFFVSTAGDDLIHFVKTSTLQDTQQINPKLPACAPGSDAVCLITTPCTPTVPASVIVAKPRSTT
jgi:hypothetical protein